MACEEDLAPLLYHIGENLLEEDVKKLLYLIGDDIPMSEKEKISTGFELMAKLREKNLIGKNCLERLKQLLSGIGREDLTFQLDPYVKKVKNINTAKHRLMLNGLVPNFIKTSKCSEVKELLENEQLAILKGISASGKSQICIWYASEFQKNSTHTVYKLLCQTEDDLLTSMRNLLEFLGMKFERQKEAKDVYIKHMAEVVKSLIESEKMKKYLLIFDDVTETTCKVVERIIHSFHQAKNVKLICSTSYSKFYEQCTERNVFVKVQGVSDTEALKFFKDHVKMKNSEDDIKTLANKMEYLPYGLVLANSYIFTTGMSVKDYVEMLSSKEFFDKVEQMITGTLQEYDKGLVSAQMLTVDKVESSSVHIKSLLQFIPFLHHNEIPTRLLRKLLPESIDDRDKVIVILDFIANVKKYCVGESTDQRETISIHAVTALVLEHRLTLEEKESSMKALLCSFCKNISIDCRLHLTFKSNMEFQPHAAKAALRAVEMKLSNEKDCMFLLCVLHTAIGVTFRVGGVESLLADEHLNKAKMFCFQLIDENDPESYMLTAEERDSMENTAYVDGSRKDRSLFQIFLWDTMKNVQKKIASRNTEVVNEQGNHRQNARAKDSKAETLFKRLLEFPEKLKEDFISDMVLETERSEPDLDYLQEVADFIGSPKDVDERKRGRMRKELYDKLLTKKLAMTQDQLSSITVVELMVIILYNNGRNHYYQCQSGQQLSLVCWNEFRLAYLLGESLQKHYPNFPSVQSLITRRNGILYHCLVSNQQPNEPGGEESGNILDKIICQYEEMLGTESSDYYEYGIIKVSQHQRLHHDAMCLNLILKCHTTRIASAVKDSVKQVHYENGLKHAKNLEELLEDKRMRRWLAFPGFHVQIARFFFEHEMEKAIKHFKRAVDLEEEQNLQRLSNFKLKSQFGLIECYLRRRTTADLEEGRTICELLKRSLHESNFQGSYQKVVKYLDDMSDHQRDNNTMHSNAMEESASTSKKKVSQEDQTIIYQRTAKRKPDDWKNLQKNNDP